MKLKNSKPAIAIASAAALMMTVSPVFARDWHRGHHRHRGVDGGDIVAGLLIFGGIAAVAAAASNSSKNKRYRDGRYPDDRDYRDQDYRDRDYRGDDDARWGDDRYGRSQSDYRGAGNIEGAVDACVAEVERGDRKVESVDRANREGDDWRIEGRVTSGGDFACTVGRDLRIRSATVDGRGVI